MPGGKVNGLHRDPWHTCLDADKSGGIRAIGETEDAAQVLHCKKGGAVYDIGIRPYFTAVIIDGSRIGQGGSGG